MKRYCFVVLLMVACIPEVHAETYSDSSITFSYPAQWKMTGRNDSVVTFSAGRNLRFTLEHIYNYDGDAVKCAEERKAAITKEEGCAVMETGEVGDVFAVKLTENIVSNGDSMRYVSYVYRDRKSDGEYPDVVTIVSFGGNASDFNTMEPHFVSVYRSIKFRMKRYEKAGKYAFDYPVCCDVKDYTGHIQYVTTNSPVIRNAGAGLKGFLIGETTPNDRPNLDTAVSLKIKYLRHAEYKNIGACDTVIGGKRGVVIYYQTDKAVHKRLFYVALKGSLYWFSFDPTEEAEKDSYYKTADMIMHTFKFYD